ncbi:MAG: hypothetical protein KDI88_11880 [Gammaproteobacteria bacterium]|nr:hypothetical protein [Gammaproteobacteria bacterium]
MLFRFRSLRLPLSRIPLVLALLYGATVHANDPVTDPYWEYRDEVGRGEFSYDDSQEVPWIENETQVTALPVVDELHRLNMDLLPREFTLFIDRDRITVGPDDYVVRMWLWVRNDQGNETGTFEGYRCDTGEYKIYAYANPRRDPPVRVHKRAKWRPADAGGQSTYRSELLRDYFCGLRGTRSAREIQASMTGAFRREYFLSE